jgi:hypothetical protein
MPVAGQNVVGIIHRIVNPEHLDKIGGLHYTACDGYEHPLDGKCIDFGVPGLDRNQVPSPWRELLEGVKGEPITFELDQADQDS